jgi:hypothetical protein
MLQCTDRRGCNLRVPVGEMGAPDRGLGDIRSDFSTTPANPLDRHQLDTNQKVTHAPANFLLSIERVSRNKPHRISNLHETRVADRASNHQTNKVSQLEQRSSNETRIEDHA